MSYLDSGQQTCEIFFRILMYLPVQTWISPSHCQHKVRRVIKLEGINLLKKMTEGKNWKYYVVQDLWKCQDRHIDVDCEGAVVQLPGEQFSSVILIQPQDLTVLKFKHQNCLLFRHQKFTFSSDSSRQSTARLHLWLILTQLPSSHVNLSGKHVVRVRDLFAPVNILCIFCMSLISKNIIVNFE